MLWKLTVLPWRQQHQHLLMEQPFRERSLIQATDSINVLLLVVDQCVTYPIELLLDVSRGQGSPMALASHTFLPFPVRPL